MTGSGGLVCLAGYALLIPKFGVWGAVWSTLLGFTWMLIFGFWHAQRVERFAFEYRRMAIIAVCAAAAAILCFVPASNNWAELLVGALVISAFPVILFFMPFLDFEEIGYLRAFFRGAFRRSARSAVGAGV